MEGPLIGVPLVPESTILLVLLERERTCEEPLTMKDRS